MPDDVGALSTRLDVPAGVLRELMAESEPAALKGKKAREYALRRFGLDRFLADWDRVLADVTACAGGAGSVTGSRCAVR